jgi:hypothetical protein
MSKGPTLTKSIGAQSFTEYLSASFEKESWCTYTGECKAHRLIFGSSEVCILCQYRMPLNIP